jgi:uncharacterized OB-fold protein
VLQQQCTFIGENEVSESKKFTLENMFTYMGQGKLMGGKCIKCSKLHFPPRPLCDCCFSKEFEWVEISPKGRLLTYTIIHVAPPQFQSIAPYVVGIVQLESGVKIPGMIKASKEHVYIRMPLTMEFEACSSNAQWPRWPGYYFVPM